MYILLFPSNFKIILLFGVGFISIQYFTHEGPFSDPCFLNFLYFLSNSRLPQDSAAHPFTVSLCTVPTFCNSLPWSTRDFGLFSQLQAPCLRWSWEDASSPPVLCIVHVGTVNSGFCICLQVCLLTAKKQLENKDYDLSSLNFHNLPQYFGSRSSLKKHILSQRA